MKDQADKLRAMALNLRQQIETEIMSNKTTRVIVIASGKGGVGKSTLAVNLSLYLCQLGYKVVLMDADLGMANIDIMLGLIPEYNLYDIICSQKTIQDIMIDGPQGLKIIPGGSGIQELANLQEGELKYIIYEMGKLDGDFDFLIVDTGAGISSNVLNFLLAGDETIIVTTSEPTSLTDAYGTVKSVHRSGFKGRIYLVVNQVSREAEGLAVAHKFQLVAKRFLQLDVEVLGHIVYDPQVNRVIMEQEPLVQTFPGSLAAQNIVNIAQKLVQDDQQQEVREKAKSKGIRAFFKKFISLNRSQ
ncbi:MAG TPA: MinD/ParA family protein [Syntrophomonadaceae bacterium]|nr:MinD/ParA family protein [Syntrophomonadaceae bacterium]